MDKYLYWLDNIPRLGRQAKMNLLDAFGSGREIYQAEEKYIRFILEEGKAERLLTSRKSWAVDGMYEKLLEEKIRFVCIREENYPDLLKKIPDPPFGLYYRGQLPEETLPAVAVVGARECSEYGRYIAEELGKQMGEHRIQVISGMARGIDGISQWAALEAGGRSFGIMGCGVDVCYPKSNLQIYERLQSAGGILSEYAPGTQPVGQLFPARNRIVSGLADVLVVIEARHKSGTSITVEMALEQGKDIYAVPGRITDRLSDGCNGLLREGAHVFLSPQDFLQELQQLLPEKMGRCRKKKRKIYVADLEAETGEYEAAKAEDAEAAASEKEDFGAGVRGDKGSGGCESADPENREKILSVLDCYPQYVDTIADRLEQQYGWKISSAALNVMLMKLCLFEDVIQVSAGWFHKNLRKC